MKEHGGERLSVSQGVKGNMLLLASLIIFTTLGNISARLFSTLKNSTLVTHITADPGFGGIGGLVTRVPHMLEQTL